MCVRSSLIKHVKFAPTESSNLSSCSIIMGNFDIVLLNGSTFFLYSSGCVLIVMRTVDFAHLLNYRGASLVPNSKTIDMYVLPLKSKQKNGHCKW